MVAKVPLVIYGGLVKQLDPADSLQTGIEALSFSLPNVINRTINFVYKSVKALTVTELYLATLSAGTCTVSFKINGVDITGLSNLSITTTPTTFTATALNALAIDSNLDLVITNAVTATDLKFRLTFAP